MKKVYKLVFDDFIEKINNFFDDAKIIPGADKIDFRSYLCYFENPTLSDPISTSKVEERFFVAYFNGKPTRFNIGYVNGVPTRLDNFEQRQQYYIQHRQDPIPHHLRQFECFHKTYTIENAKNMGLHLRGELMELDEWPLYFSGKCTNECKVKMKKVYKLVFDDFIEKINNFFDDAKIIPGAGKIDFHCYLCYFEHPTLSNPLFTSKVEERFFVAYFNGKPTRLINLPL
ncbi:hypothetical protein ACTFIY_011928 [Dictyostelium cf. discoideum]